MERMEDHLLKIEIMLSDNCLPPGMVPAVPRQSQVIAQLQSRLELLEKISVLTDFAGVKGAPWTIRTKGSDSEQTEEELTPERLHTRTGNAIDTEMGGSVMIPTIPELLALGLPEHIINDNLSSRMIIYHRECRLHEMGFARLAPLQRGA